MFWRSTTLQWWIEIEFPFKRIMLNATLPQGPEKKFEELEWEILSHPAHTAQTLPHRITTFSDRWLTIFKTGASTIYRRSKLGAWSLSTLKGSDGYRRGIFSLAERWVKTITYNGLHFEGWIFLIHFLYSSLIHRKKRKYFWITLVYLDTRTTDSWRMHIVPILS